jgi:DNA invertase Pin-like site-specific DNA recombinase
MAPVPFKKILGYCRVSRTEQASDDTTSLQTQEREIRGSAMIRGVDSVEIFSDPGVSGSIPLAERPAGARLVAALEPGTLVAASKLDRIFRSASDALSTVERWKVQGIDLILVDCGTEPVSANGNSKLFFGILASVAEFEKGRIAERMREGRKGKAERGGHIGGLPPYGYRKVGCGRGAMLEVDPAEQATIASVKVKRLRDQGVSVRKIIDRLTADGVVLRSGRPFTVAQLSRIVHHKPRD